jgi:ketosteroid isomerase-like protein
MPPSSGRLTKVEDAMPTDADDPRIAQIIALDEQRRAAMIAEDFASLDRLLADDLVHVHAGGNADSKQQYFRLIEDVCAFVAIGRGPMTVRFYGDTAILTGPMTHTVRIKPTGAIRTMDAFGTQVWAPHGNSWRQVLYQATEIAAHQG